ncbi:hypothetical protein ACHAWX_003895 [Stephanocyclus meneghinianus]
MTLAKASFRKRNYRRTVILYFMITVAGCLAMFKSIVSMQLMKQKMMSMQLNGQQIGMPSAPVEAFHIKNLPQNFTVRSLPRWMADYVAFHQRNVKISVDSARYEIKNGTRWLRAVRRRGGVGDRINGILAVMLLAMCNNRTFLLEPDWSPLEIGSIFEPRLIQWNATITDVPDLFWDEASGSILNGIEPFPVNFTGIDMVASNYWHPPPNWITQSECYNQLLHRDGDNVSTVDPLRIYHNQFWSLFKFTKDAHNRSQAMLQHAGVDPNRYFIGAHYRAGDQQFLGNVDWAASRLGTSNDTVSEFYNCTKKLQYAMKQCMQNAHLNSSNNEKNVYLPQIYFASDNDEIKNQYFLKDPSTIRIADIEIFHVDLTGPTPFNDTKQAALDVFSELKILIDSTCLVHYRSGYSEIAAWVGSSPRCAIRYDQCSNKDVEQALANIGCHIDLITNE